MTKGKFDFDAIVVGAGFSGMYQLHLLRDKLGLNVLGIEAGGGVGGTWYWNRYPGARCDSESHSYNYFFSDEIIQNWEWSERYPGQEEIRRYLNYVADTLKLRSSFEFNSRVVGASFHEDLGGWSVTTENGVTRTCQFFITAVGCLSSANMPNIKGLDKFQGSYYHTGNWPHEGVDFSGKRVGQIGTGSTGIQCVPVIAQTAKELRVFQRTANYSIPAHNGPLDDEF
ncbi:MAG: NAD(P)/FAD-dependent oxidoreductase, partial [Alphaproteobacteria bacterium]|nr:NAD(P)/FAD-dependent oxidoreductase [Alphaproteobacteria bacterium]